MNIKLIISYDGTHFLGWQDSLNLPTIEGVLRSALKQIYQEPITLQAAARTDRGVHAEGQVVNFRTERKKDLERVKYSLNQMLPKTIRIGAIQEEEESFHPTLDVIGKEYHYFVTLSPIQSPFDRHFSWHFFYPIDLKRMQQAATFFIGNRDFAAFCNVNDSPAKSTVRTLTRIDMIEEGERLRFEVEGEHFLYKMVRNIVGTLLYVGRGELSLQKAEALISGRNRTQGGITAPAHGLTLKRVIYQ